MLNHFYRFPPGARDYAVTYAAPHIYRDGMQSLILKSDEVLGTPTQWEVAPRCRWAGKDLPTNRSGGCAGNDGQR